MLFFKNGSSVSLFLKAKSEGI